eukprot:15481357-Alexandrium_andersonii.AAC.1
MLLLPHSCCLSLGHPDPLEGPDAYKQRRNAQKRQKCPKCPDKKAWLVISACKCKCAIAVLRGAGVYGS